MKKDEKEEKKPQTSETRSQSKLIAIALILRFGGHDLHKDEIERAKDHSLEVSDVDGEPDLLRVGAIPVQ